MLGILHSQIAERWPQARVASLAALGAVAVGLAAYATGGLYSHDNTTVHTARGTFVTNAASALAIQAAVRSIDADTHPAARSSPRRPTEVSTSWPIARRRSMVLRSCPI